MTVPARVPRNTYAGSGSTGPFPYEFMIDAKTDLKVIRRDSAGVETTLVVDIDYTVTGVGVETGGSITLTAVLATGYSLAILSNLPVTQNAEYINNDNFPYDRHEGALDRIIRIVQQFDERIRRCFSVPKTSGLSLLDLEPHAQYLIGWNSAATGLQNYPTAALSIPTIDHIGNHADDLPTAVTDIGAAEQLLLINKAINLSANTTTPNTMDLWVPNGGKIALGSYWLQIDGPFKAGNGVFEITPGGGQVLFGLNGPDIIHARWWKTTTNTWEEAIAAAVTAVGTEIVGGVPTRTETRDTRTVAVRNQRIALGTTGVQCKLNNWSELDLRGTLFTKADDSSIALDLSYGVLSTAANRTYYSRVLQPNVDFGAATRTASIGLKYYAPSGLTIEGGRINDAYIGMDIAPCDNVNIRGPLRLQWNVIGMRFANWLSTSGTGSLQTIVNGCTFTYKDNSLGDGSTHGILFQSQYLEVNVEKCTFSGNLSTADIRVQNTAPVGTAGERHTNFNIIGNHFEQALSGVNRIWFEAVQVSPTGLGFKAVNIIGNNISVPNGCTGIRLERVESAYIAGNNISGPGYTVTDAVVTSGSNEITSAAGNFVTGGAAVDMYVHGPGILEGSRITIVDTNKITIGTNATGNFTSARVTVIKACPMFFDSACLGAEVHGANWSTAPAVIQCARNEVTFHPPHRPYASPVVLTGYSAAALDTGNVTLRMENLMGAPNLPLEARPKGYWLRVTAVEGSTGPTTRITFAPSAALVATEGEYYQIDTMAKTTTHSFYMNADSNGNIYMSVVASGSKVTTTIAVDAIEM